MLSVKDIREKILPVCEKYAISEAYLFGSYARGDATEESDVDLRIVVEKPFGMLASKMRHGKKAFKGKEKNI